MMPIFWFFNSVGKILSRLNVIEYDNNDNNDHLFQWTNAICRRDFQAPNWTVSDLTLTTFIL